MPTYTKPKPGSELHEILAAAIEEWHPELSEAGVTIGLQVAWPGENADPDVSAVKLHGYECAAVIRITPAKWRLRGVEDAVIEVDGKTWERLTEPERVALIDHELTHLEIARDKDGVIKSDDQGRPKLKMRLHDFQIGGFGEIVRRHGSSALELQNLKATVSAYRQQVFSFSDDMAGEREVA